MTSIPAHVGLIMDGNRRWAKQNGKLSIQGHEAGVQATRRVVKHLINSGVKFVSAYAFSTENWSRDSKEVDYLMNLVPKVLKKYLSEFEKEGIRIVVLGSLDRLSRTVVEAISEAESRTRHNSRGIFAVCFNYGGMHELVDACKEIIRSHVSPDQVTADSLAAHLYHPEIPQCDLIVRTSGEKRLSGFMLARSEYAEFIFEDKFWPDVNEADVDSYLAEYTARQRRHGK